MSKTALDLFGRLLMTKVRDETISDWKMILDGRMKGERALKLREALDNFSGEQRKAFLSLVPEIADTVLHHLLSTLEQEHEIRIGIGQDVHSLSEVSDGLAGELYSDEGWIARFSKERA